MMELTLHVNILWLLFAIWFKTMKLFELVLKEKAIFFAYDGTFSSGLMSTKL